MAPPRVLDDHPYMRFDDGTTRISEELQYVELRDRKSGEDDSDDPKNPKFPGPAFHQGSLQEEQTFTFRAVLVGTLLGSIIAASNMYLGLTVGWSFGASLFGSIVGFAILKPLSRILPAAFGGGYFGPKENCTVQSAATSAGGLSVGFVSAIPALYRLGLMSERVVDDVVPLILWSLAAAYYGLFFAIPLRRYFILKQKLVFPSPTVAAQTIKSLHDSAEGELNGAKKARVLLVSFAIAFVLKCITWWIPVVLEWHILYYFGRAVNSAPLMVADVAWKWRIELAGAFLGAGMLIGINTASSFFSGSLTAWAIVGPIMLGAGIVHDAFGFPANLDPNNPLPADQFNRQVTAQYWLLWPGVTMMIASSFAELGVRWRSLWRGVTGLFVETKKSVGGLTRVRRSSAQPFTKLPEETLDGSGSQGGSGVHHRGEESDGEEDPALPHEQVPTLWWGGGLIVSGIFTTVVLATQFNISVYEGLVAILLGFILAFVGLQASGETDINPTGSIGKTSQFVFAAFKHDSIRTSLKTNLVAGNVAAACAAQTVDMVGDLKTAHLLRAPPRSQFLAQAISSLFAIFLSVGLFVLFGTSYPCFLRPPVPGQTCQFEAPAVASWTAVSVALTSGVDKTVPFSAAITSLVVAVLCVVFTVVKYRVRPEVRVYLPNLNAVGIALVNPQPYIGLAMFLGAVFNLVWKRRSPTTNEMYCYAIASGLIAGEGIGGIVEAVYALVGIDRDARAVKWGIPTGVEIGELRNGTGWWG
ncbi:hypothetical protein HK104_006587 [Borealophlyctis nickersoniae]|nr:hypothetical protein HK104_006587 [Borealophlyctis nickersoniae]